MQFIESIFTLGQQHQAFSLAVMQEDESKLPENYTEYVSEKGLYTWVNRLWFLTAIMYNLLLIALEIFYGSFVIGYAVLIYIIYFIWMISYMGIIPPFGFAWQFMFYKIRNCKDNTGYSFMVGFIWFLLRPSFCSPPKNKEEEVTE